MPLARVKHKFDRFLDFYNQSYPWDYYPDVYQMWRTLGGYSEDTIPYSKEMVKFLWDLQPNDSSRRSVGGSNNFLNNRQKALPAPYDLDAYTWTMKAEAVISGGNLVNVLDINEGRDRAKIECIYYRQRVNTTLYNHIDTPHLIHQLWAIGRNGKVILPFANKVVYFPLFSKQRDSHGRGYYYMKLSDLDFNVSTAPEPPIYSKFLNQDMINAVYKAAEALEIDGWQLVSAAGLSWLVNDRKAEYTGPLVGGLPLPEYQWRAIQAAILGRPIPVPEQKLWMLEKHDDAQNKRIKIWGESYKPGTDVLDYGLSEKEIGYYVEGDLFKFIGWNPTANAFTPTGFARDVPRSEAIKIRIVERGELAQTNDEPHFYADAIRDFPAVEGWVESKNIKRVLGT